MEARYAYERKETVNGYIQQKPYYVRSGTNFRLPDYHGKYHKGMIMKKGLFRDMYSEGLANPAVLLAITLMAVETEKGNARFLISCEFGHEEPTDDMKPAENRYIECLRPWAIRCILGNQNAPDERIESISTPLNDVYAASCTGPRSIASTPS